MVLASSSDSALFRNLPCASLGKILGLEADLVDRLRSSPRLASRTLAAMQRRLGMLPAPCTTAQTRLLKMDGAQLHGVALEIGAVCFAPAVLRIVEGAAVRRLVACIGKMPWEAALKWRALAPPEEAISINAAPEELAAWLGEAGHASLNAWCAVQPHEVGARLGLLLNPTRPAAAVLARLEPAVVERIIADGS